MARPIDHRMDDDAYERVTLADDDHHWELWDGMLVEMPGMSLEHNHALVELVFQLRGQPDQSQYRIRANSTRVGKPRSSFIPDVLVVPFDAVRPLRGCPGATRNLRDFPAVGRRNLVAFDGALRHRQEAAGVHGPRRPRNLAHPPVRAGRHRVAPSGRRFVRGSRVLGGRVEAHALSGVWIDLDALFDEF